MLKIVLFFLLVIFCFRNSAQCTPLNLSLLKQLLMVSDKERDAQLTSSGFAKPAIDFTIEEGYTYCYNACYVNFKDGYNHYSQTICWTPRHTAISFVTLDKKNFEEIKSEIKKISKPAGMDGIYELYEEPGLIYSLGVETKNDPLQVYHPSYVIAILQIKK